MGNKKVILWISLIAILVVLIGLGLFFAIKRGLINPQAVTGTPTLSLDPTNKNVAPNGVFLVNINIDTAGNPSDGAVAVVGFDSNNLTVTDANGNAVTSISSGSFYGNVLTNSVSGGKIRYSEMVPLGNTTGKTGAGKLASFYFKATNAGNTNVNIINNLPNPTLDINFSQISNHLDSGNTTPANILSAVVNASYTIGTPQPAPTVDIKADGSNGPITKNQGGSTTLSWTSTNATSCSASGGWSGSKSTSGSQTLSNLTASKVYTLACSGAGGSTLDSVTINVTIPGTNPPLVDIKANNSNGPINIAKGNTATLSWNSSRATSCTASGAWSGTKSTSGQETTGKLDSSKTYNLSCRNNDGTTIDSVIVNVSSSGGATTTDNSSSTSTNTPQEVSKLPSNIQPQSKPSKNEVTLTKNDAMKPWALWFLYAIIPAFLAGGAIYIYLRRRKANQHNESI